MRKGSILLKRLVDTFLVAWIIALGLGTAPAGAAEVGTVIDRMPADLETRFALSAAPSTLRSGATVYLLDPKVGYTIARSGSNGLSCLVERTAWELKDYRNDIYIPLCYDAEGAKTYLKVKLDAAALRAKGMGVGELHALISKRFADKTYKVPGRAGLSYMIAPLQRTISPPKMQVQTLIMPHLMFYAPNVTDADISAAPDLANVTSLASPFIDRQGNGEQSYMIQFVGASERARILTDEKALIDALCAYRDLLCSPRELGEAISHAH